MSVEGLARQVGESRSEAWQRRVLTDQVFEAHADLIGRVWPEKMLLVVDAHGNKRPLSGCEPVTLHQPGQAVGEGEGPGLITEQRVKDLTEALETELVSFGFKKDLPIGGVLGKNKTLVVFLGVNVLPCTPDAPPETPVCLHLRKWVASRFNQGDDAELYADMRCKSVGIGLDVVVKDHGTFTRRFFSRSGVVRATNHQAADPIFHRSYEDSGVYAMSEEERGLVEEGNWGPTIMAHPFLGSPVRLLAYLSTPPHLGSFDKAKFTRAEIDGAKGLVAVAKLAHETGGVRATTNLRKLLSKLKTKVQKRLEPVQPHPVWGRGTSAPYRFEIAYVLGKGGEGFDTAPAALTQIGRLQEELQGEVDTLEQARQEFDEDVGPVRVWLQQPPQMRAGSPFGLPDPTEEEAREFVRQREEWLLGFETRFNVQRGRIEGEVAELQKVTTLTAVLPTVVREHLLRVGFIRPGWFGTSDAAAYFKYPLTLMEAYEQAMLEACGNKDVDPMAVEQFATWVGMIAALIDSGATYDAAVVYAESQHPWSKSVMHQFGGLRLGRNLEWRLRNPAPERLRAHVSGAEVARREIKEAGKRPKKKFWEAACTLTLPSEEVKDPSGVSTTINVGPLLVGPYAAPVYRIILVDLLPLELLGRLKLPKAILLSKNRGEQWSTTLGPFTMFQPRRVVFLNRVNNEEGREAFRRSPQAQGERVLASIEGDGMEEMLCSTRAAVEMTEVVPRVYERLFRGEVHVRVQASTLGSYCDQLAGHVVGRLEAYAQSDDFGR